VIDANPRRQFILDLQSWLQHHLKQNHEIILAMDANMMYDPDITGQAYPLTYKENVPITDHKHNGLLSSLIATCGLIDPLARQHSSRPFPASYIKPHSTPVH
jgi:exonuclease III